MEGVRPQRFQPVSMRGDGGLNWTAHGSLLDSPISGTTHSSLWDFVVGPDEPRRSPVRHPLGMAVDGGRLLVCDQGVPDILSVNLKTGHIARFTQFGDQPPCPVDVTLDATGVVYVADTSRGSVLLFSPDGKFLDALTPPHEQARAFRPSCLCASGGVLYVGNTLEGTVLTYSIDNREWTGRLPLPDGGRLGAPSDLAVTGAGTLLVVDAVQCVVHRWTEEGGWDVPIGHRGRGVGEFVRPLGVAVTANGFVAVTDAGRQSVLLFDDRGKFQGELAGVDERWSGFTLPVGIAYLGESLKATVLQRLSSGGVLNAQDLLIVSDPLNGESLSVIGFELPDIARVASQ